MSMLIYLHFIVIIADTGELFLAENIARERRRDRILSLYIVATMVLLTTLLVVTFVGFIKNSKPVRLRRRLVRTHSIR